MGNRINIDTLAEMQTVAREAFLDGIIEGKPIAKTVSYILQLASSFGADESERSINFPVATTYDDYNEMKREVTALVINRLFTQSGIDGVVSDIVLHGSAFGFRTAKQKKS